VSYLFQYFSAASLVGAFTAWSSDLSRLQLVDANPGDHKHRSNRSAAHAKAKDYKAALDDAEAVTTMMPLWPKVDVLGLWARGSPHNQ
jgi:hypothetical protein